MSQNNKSSKIIQIGCGVVGHAYAKSYQYFGSDVIGIDVMPHIIQKLNDDGITTYHAKNVPSTIQANIILMSLPTPLIKETQELDMKYLYSTVPTVAQLVTQSTKKPLVVLRSTIPPGMTQIYKKKLNDFLTDNMKDHFNIIFQPEFLRAISAFKDAKNPWRVIVGVDKKCKDIDDIKSRINSLYKPCLPNMNMIKYIKIEEAEMFKLIHNYRNALQISYANTIYGICASINNDIDAEKILNMVTETSEACLNRQYGLTPGKEYGGTCLPKDVPQLTMLAPPGPLRNFVYSTTDINEFIRTHKTLRKKEKIKESPNWTDCSKLLTNA
jgi:UDPglucose 6-dehydrogenase